jgi:hypothetical protein
LEEQLIQDSQPLFGSMHTAMDETTLGDRFAHLAFRTLNMHALICRRASNTWAPLPTIQEDGMMPAWWDDVRPTAV